MNKLSSKSFYPSSSINKIRTLCKVLLPSNQKLLVPYTFRQSVYVNHRDTTTNNQKTPFEFTDQNYNNLMRILKKYPSNYKKSAVIPALMMAQKQNNNFLSLSAMNKVAKILQMPKMAVYEVASFYSMFNRTPVTLQFSLQSCYQQVGKYHLQVCGTTPCMVRGARKIIKAISDYADIKNGQTSEDGLFTLQQVECLGACVNAPMMQVNNQFFYEDLTPENTVKILQNWKNGKQNTPGPQIQERKNCQGCQGRTSLSDPESLNRNLSRDFGKAKDQWLEQKQKAQKK